MKLIKKVASLVVAAMILSSLPLHLFADESGATPYPVRSVDIDSVSFPSNLFRKYVSTNFDLDNDGVLSPEEINAVKEIDINLTKYSYGWDRCCNLKGVEIFTNLENLYCNYNDLTSLDLSQNTKLKRLSMSGNNIEEYVIQFSNLEMFEFNEAPIKSLIIKNCPNLKELDLSTDWSIETLEITNCPSIEKFTIGRNYLKSLDVSPFENLKELDICITNIDKLDLSHNKELTKLSLYKNSISELNLDVNTKLETLYIEELPISSIDLSNNTALNNLLISDTHITAIDVSMLTNLERLVLEYMGLTSLDVTNNTNLVELRVYNTSVKHLDVSRNPNLYLLDLLLTSVNKLNITNNPILVDYYENPKEVQTYGGEPLSWSGISYGNDQEHALVIDTKTEIVIDPEEPEATPEVTPEVSPEVTPEVSPESTPEVTPEITQEVTEPEVTPEITPVVSPEVTSEATPTVSPEVTGEATPEVTPDANQPFDEVRVGNMINRLYSVALDRAPEDEGFEYWVNKLRTGEACGAQIAYGVLFSQEYIERERTNGEFIADLYEIEFGRAPDPEGFNYWLNILNSNNSREDVYAGFANSVEFNNLCDSYGIIAGTYVENVSLERQGLINAFVVRLYKYCLNRVPDQAGMAMWVNQLARYEISGVEIATAFIYSEEFMSQDMTNEEYILTLYHVFFGREPDTDGYNFWVQELNRYGDRELVFRSFANSKEFIDLCGLYNLPHLN